MQSALLILFLTIVGGLFHMHAWLSVVKVMASAPTGGTVSIGAEAQPIVYSGRLHVGNVTNVEC